MASVPHAILFLSGTLSAGEEGLRFESPEVPEGVRVGLAGRFRAYAPKVAGQRRVFHAFPRITPKGGLYSLQLARAYPELPPLPKGQCTGLAGEGPYYVIVKPQLAGRWERIESALDRFPAPHRVLRYPDGTRAIECPDREALRVFYKSTFSL